MSDILEKFVSDVKAAYGENLKSVVLYGSKASAEDTKKHSDYNVLVVLDSIKFDDLKSMNKAMVAWIAGGNQPPLLFTSERLKNSADVFPIEFLDIKSNHRILFGEDPFTDLQIHDKHLRHECEFELKGKLLKLRQGYMLTRGKEGHLKDLLINSVTTFLIIFRYVLKLTGQEPPAKRLDALEILSKKVVFDPSPFATIFAMKQGDKEALKNDAEPLTEKYLAEIEKVVDFVDKMQVK
ncbi:MAG: hypothetical protein JW803_09550 [Endomicrobiales bacterium]|nr:hypothetical protein [Endomicrobiales bacterium]